MNTQSNTFDQDKGKRIAFNVDDSQPKNDQTPVDKYFPNNLMNRQLLSSEKLTSTGFQFALAYLRQDLDEVKLIPIKNVLDFKPAFRYMDKVKIRTSNKNQDDSDEEDEQEFSANKPEPATKMVTMRFEDKRKSNDLNHVRQDKPESEEWIGVQYFDYGLPKFEKEKDVVLYKMNQEADIDE